MEKKTAKRGDNVSLRWRGREGGSHCHVTFCRFMGWSLKVDNVFYRRPPFSPYFLFHSGGGRFFSLKAKFKWNFRCDTYVLAHKDLASPINVIMMINDHGAILSE